MNKKKKKEKKKKKKKKKEREEREEIERKEREEAEEIAKAKREEEERLEKERFEKEEKERLAREYKEKNTVPEPWPKDGLPCDICKNKIWGKDTAVKIDGVLQHRKCQENKQIPIPASNQARPSALIKDHKAKMKKIQAQSAKHAGPRASYMLRSQISGMKKTVTETGMDNKTKDAPDADLAAKLRKRAEETEAKEKEDQRIREEKEKEKEKVVVAEAPKVEEIKDGKDSEGFPVPWPKGGLQCEVCKAKIWGRDTAAIGDNQAVIHAKCKGVDSSQLKKSEDIAAKLSARAIGDQTSVYVYTGKGNAPDVWQMIGAFDLHWIGLEPVVDENTKTRTVVMPVDETTNVQVQEKETGRNDEEFWYTYAYPQPPPGLEFLKQGGVARMSLTQQGEDVIFEWKVTFKGTKNQATDLTQTLSSAEPAVQDAYRAALPEESDSGVEGGESPMMIQVTEA